MAPTFPWTRGTEAARAANSTTPAAGMLAVTNEGNVYAVDGSTTWAAATRLAKTTDVAAAQAAAVATAASDATTKAAAAQTAAAADATTKVAATPKISSGTTLPTLGAATKPGDLFLKTS